VKRQSSRLRIPPHSGEEFAVDVRGAFDDVEDIRAQETRGDPDVVETSGYAAAFERAIRLLDPLSAATTTMAARIIVVAHPLSGAIAGKLVGDHHPGRPLLFLQQLAQQPLGRALVAPALHQNVEHNAVLVHRSP
jgi:hypothetical protein